MSWTLCRPRPVQRLGRAVVEKTYWIERLVTDRRILIADFVAFSVTDICHSCSYGLPYSKIQETLALASIARDDLPASSTAANAR